MTAAPSPPVPGLATAPGSIGAAQIVLWTQFAVGIGSGAVSLIGYCVALTFDHFPEPTAGFLWLALFTAPPMALTVLRAVCAVRLPRRSDRARKGAIAVEMIGLLGSLGAWYFLDRLHLVYTYTGAALLGADEEVVNGMSDWYALGIGPALALLGMAFLMTNGSRSWCDR